MSENVIINCPNYNLLAHVEVLGSYENENPYDWMDAEKFVFAKCPGCNQPILMQSERTLDGIQEPDLDVVWSSHLDCTPQTSFI